MGFWCDEACWSSTWRGHEFMQNRARVHRSGIYRTCTYSVWLLTDHVTHGRRCHWLPPLPAAHRRFRSASSKTRSARLAHHVSSARPASSIQHQHPAPASSTSIQHQHPAPASSTSISHPASPIQHPAKGNHGPRTSTMTTCLILLIFVTTLFPCACSVTAIHNVTCTSTHFDPTGSSVPLPRPVQCTQKYF